MARIDFKKYDCSKLQIPAYEEIVPIEKITVSTWNTPFTAPFYMKVGNAPYGGNLLDPNMEGIIGWPFHPGDGRFRSLEKLLKTDDKSCYSLETFRNPSLNIRFRIECRKDARSVNIPMVVTNLNVDLYLIEYISPITNQTINFLVWKV